MDSNRRLIGETLEDLQVVTEAVVWIAETQSRDRAAHPRISAEATDWRTRETSVAIIAQPILAPLSRCHLSLVHQFAQLLIQHRNRSGWTRVASHRIEAIRLAQGDQPHLPHQHHDGRIEDAAQNFAEVKLRVIAREISNRKSR
jgi:hypothetical protein